MSILEPFSVYPTVNLTKGVIEMTGWTKYVLIVFVLTFTRCGDSKSPEGILTKQEMVSLMVDMYIAEAKISISRISRDSAFRLFDPYEDATLADRGITDSLLKVNYNYYLQKPKELEQILDAVIDTLNLREQRLGIQP
jgi:hypothetical protein